MVVTIDIICRGCASRTPEDFDDDCKTRTVERKLFKVYGNGILRYSDKDYGLLVVVVSKRLKAGNYEYHIIETIDTTGMLSRIL